MTWMEWYNALAKPSWTPAPATITTIWCLLYPVIVISFGFVFIRYWQGRLNAATALPFLINIVANLLFMPIFSGLRSIPFACLDVVTVWATLVWCMAAIYSSYRWIAAAQIPYLIWVTIATTIQILITAWNN